MEPERATQKNLLNQQKYCFLSTVDLIPATALLVITFLKLAKSAQ